MIEKIQVSPDIVIDPAEITWDFIRASGPGGQNVNKVATAVQLRFNVIHSPSLSDDVKDRLVRIAGKRMTKDGVLVIEAKRFRSQERNREDAIQRLVDLVRKALVPPRIRKPTRPSRAAKKRRLDEKRQRSQIKRMRRIDPDA